MVNLLDRVLWTHDRMTAEELHAALVKAIGNNRRVLVPSVSICENLLHLTPDRPWGRPAPDNPEASGRLIGTPDPGCGWGGDLLLTPPRAVRKDVRALQRSIQELRAYWQSAWYDPSILSKIDALDQALETVLPLTEPAQVGPGAGWEGAAQALDTFFLAAFAAMGSTKKHGTSGGGYVVAFVCICLDQMEWDRPPNNETVGKVLRDLRAASLRRTAK